MYFEERNEISTIVNLRFVQKYPEKIIQHFQNYGDEVFYVAENGNLYGIITLGDVYRGIKVIGGAGVKPNRNFQYIKDRNDCKWAEEIFARYPTIHEVAVIKDGLFLGRMKSGVRKSEEEWKQIRRSICAELEYREFIVKNITKLLKTKASIYIYRWLRVQDMGLTDEERAMLEERKRLLPTVEGLTTLTWKEQASFFGDNCTPDYVVQLIQEISEREIVYENGIAQWKDREGKIFNIRKGQRIVPAAPSEASKKIFMVGPCTMYGGLVNDNQTIETFLQRILSEKGFCDYEVINCSVTGDLSVPKLFSEKIAEKDIIIYMSTYFDVWKTLEKDYPRQLKCLETMAEIWKEIDSPMSHVYNLAEHCNHVVNQKIAEKMFDDIEDCLCMEAEKDVFRKPIQNYYISWNVVAYYKEHFSKFVNGKRRGVAGAVVMNCNPFTKGHRYLIEKACAEVDFLYIFVVEEDLSVFPSQARFEMVKSGTKDLENVYVLPSGEYMISNKTFEQYFKKENVSSVEDMDYDVHIFGEVVAKELEIKYRFVGEEPFDQVTAKYNETMKRILPQYGIKLIEIPRMRDCSGEIISASRVRQYIREGHREKAEGLLPENIMWQMDKYKDGGVL